jgi:hypothetical protein
VYRVHSSEGTAYLLKKFPYTQQQPVAMSNNDAPDLEKARGLGLRDSNKTSDRHGDRGNTGSPHVANDTEREHRHFEQGHTGTGDSNTNEEQWTEVRVQTKGDKQSNSNGVGTGSGRAALTTKATTPSSSETETSIVSYRPGRLGDQAMITNT